MITARYEIEFAFSLDEAKLALRLSAEVEVHRSQLFYIVKNIRRKGAAAPVLPQISIKKKLPAGSIPIAAKHHNSARRWGKP